MSEELSRKDYRFIPILCGMDYGWRVSQALDYFRIELRKAFPVDPSGCYEDLENIKKELPEVWNKIEKRLKRAHNNEKLKLTDIIQSILIEEHDYYDYMHHRLVYAYPPIEIFMEEE